MVGLGGLEPPASPLSGVRSNQLSYRPNLAGLAFSSQILVKLLHFSKTNCVGALFNSRLIKEVIQPQVPLRLPCYDFTPVMNHKVVSALLKG